MCSLEGSNTEGNRMTQREVERNENTQPGKHRAPGEQRQREQTTARRTPVEEAQTYSVKHRAGNSHTEGITLSLWCQSHDGGNI